MVFSWQRNRLEKLRRLQLHAITCHFVSTVAVDIGDTQVYSNVVYCTQLKHLGYAQFVFQPDFIPLLYSYTTVKISEIFNRDVDLRYGYSMFLYNEFTSGLHWVYIEFTPGSQTVCKRFTSGIHMVQIRSTIVNIGVRSGLHLVYIRFILGLHSI